MNEQQLIDSLRRHLDLGLEQLPASTRDRLHAARQAAIAHKAGKNGSRRHAHQGWLRPALATLALAAGIGLATTYLQGQNEISAMAALDSDLLIDDLPPKAFTDPGFRAWLEESSEG